MKRSLGAALLVVILLPAAAFGAKYRIDPVHSNVGFTIGHMVGRVNGYFTGFQGTLLFDEQDPAKSSVQVEIDAASITTFNADRDKHLRSEDFFFVARHPRMTFRSTGVTKVGDRRYQVAGDLTIRGVTRPATLDAVYGGTVVDPQGNTRIGFVATTTLDRTEFGVSYNADLPGGGKALSDEVEIRLQVEAILEKEAPFEP